MRTKHSSLAVASLAALMLAAAASPAAAQSKIAVANPAKIFNDLQEVKDIGEKINADSKSFVDEVNVRRKKIDDLTATRDSLKSDSPQWDDLNKQISSAKAELQTWGQTTQDDMQRRQKETMRRIYDKIVTTIGVIATEKGFDMVLSEQNPEVPDNLDKIRLDALQGMLLNRNILFIKPEMNISAEVTTRLDADYKAGATPPPTPPTPQAGGN